MTRSVLGIGTLGLIAALTTTPALLAQQQGGGQRQGQQGGQQQQGAQQGGQSLVGQNAPTFNLKDFEGKAHTLQDYRGKVVILEWIDPTNEIWKQKLEDPACKAEYERYKAQGVVFLPIFAFTGTQGQQPGMQGGAQQPGGQQQRQGGMQQQHGGMQHTAVKQLDEQAAIAACRELKQTQDIDFPILLDNGGRVTQQFKVERLPHVLIVDKQGVVAYQCGASDFTNALDRAIRGESSLPASAPRQDELDRQMRDRQLEEQRRR